MIRNILTTTLLIATFLVFGLESFAQTPVKDLSRIWSLNDSDKAVFNMTFSWYSGHKATIPAKTESHKVMVMGNNMIRETEDYIALINRDHSITVHHEAKTMMIQPSIIWREKSIMPDWDSMLNTCSQVLPIGPEAGKSGYRFFFSDSALITRMDLVFDPATFRVLEVSMYYQAGLMDTEELPGETPTRLTISFDKIALKAPLTKADFESRRFLKKEKGTYEPSSLYADYRLLNALPR
ncbi:MAG: hypothetical protein AB8F95_17375 [Bacteroidia bacterium]